MRRFGHAGPTIPWRPDATTTLDAIPTDDEERLMEPDDWLAQLASALPGDAGPLGASERAVLLDLARVAAHTSERWTAPLSTFVAGVALAQLDADARVDALRRVVASFDDPDAPDVQAPDAPTRDTRAPDTP